MSFDIRASSSLLCCRGAFYAKKRARQGRFAVTPTNSHSRFDFFGFLLLSRSAVLEVRNKMFYDRILLRTRFYDARDDKTGGDSKFTKLSKVFRSLNLNEV